MSIASKISLPLAFLIAASGTSAKAATEILLTPVSEAGALALPALKSHALVLSSTPVFGPREQTLLKQMGENWVAQSLRAQVDSPKEFEELSRWAYARFKGVRVQLNAGFKMHSASEDSYLRSLQWGFNNDGRPQKLAFDDVTTVDYPAKRGEDIGLDRARAGGALLSEAQPGRKIIVAVLDSGIDGDHPDLAPQMIDRVFEEQKRQECRTADLWTRCRRSAGRNEELRAKCDAQYMKLDADGNGYPMDCRGWNVQLVDAKTQALLPANPVSGILGEPNPKDDIGHGTHVAGLIGAKPSANGGGEGVRGAAEDVAILPVRIIRSEPNEPIRPQETRNPLKGRDLIKTSNDDLPQPTESDLHRAGFTESFVDVVARGMLYAIASKADVINMSLAWNPGSDSALMQAMVQIALKRGIIVVASAGNDSNDARVLPCAYDGVLCVAAHGPDGGITHFSNYGASVDLAAPGTRVLSTYPIDKRSNIFTAIQGYEYKEGTSMAAPIVSGLAARLLSQGLSPREIYARLMSGTRESSASFKQSAELPHKFTRSGNVDLPLALEAVPDALILPASKRTLVYPWDRKLGALPVEITLTNYWETSDVELSARVLPSFSGAPVPTLSQSSWTFKGWQADAPRSVTTQLLVDSSEIEGRIAIEFTARTARGARRVFQVPVEITVPVDAKLIAGADVENLPVSGEVKISPSTLRSVNGLTRDSEVEYMLIEYVRTEGKVTAWKLQLAELVQSGDKKSYRYREPVEIPAPGQSGDALASLQRLDLRRPVTTSSAPALQSSLPGYVLITLVEPSAGGARTPIFRFTELSHSLAPQRTYEYDQSTGRVSDRAQWAYIPGQGMSLAWVGLARTPPSEKPPYTPWDPEPQDPTLFRFLYITADGLKSLKAPETYSFLDTLAASDAQIARGEVPVLLAKTDEDTTDENQTLTYARAVVRDGRVEDLTPLTLPSFRFLNALPNSPPVLSLGSGSEFGDGVTATAITGESVPGSQRTSFIPLQGSQVQVDSIIGPISELQSVVAIIGAFDGAGESGAFTQAHYDLQWHDFKEGKTVATSLNRYSYLPSFITATTMFPIVVGPSRMEASGASSGTRRPGILIPDGLGDSPAMEVVVPYRAAGRLTGLSRPARLRFAPTDVCPLTQNPRSAHAGSAAQAVFFCRDRWVRISL